MGCLKKKVFWRIYKLQIEKCQRTDHHLKSILLTVTFGIVSDWVYILKMIGPEGTLSDDDDDDDDDVSDFLNILKMICNKVTTGMIMIMIMIKGTTGILKLFIRN